MLYPIQCFYIPEYRFVNDRTEFMVFDDIDNLEMQINYRLSGCTSYEVKELRSNHFLDEILIIDTCRSITTRYLPAATSRM
jgi:hypothetical protein